jgi:DnaJ-class molecular chaperone
MEKKATINVALTPIISGPLIFKGAGNEGENGTGNLIIEVFVDKDKTYTASGLDLKRNLTISPVQAIIGDTVKLNIWGKEENLIIPPGTKDGQLIKKSGAGLRHENRTGDLCVLTYIKIPQIISAKEQELYRQLLEIEKESCSLDM